MSEFRDNLSAYLDAVEKGRTVTITRRGKASAVLTGVKQLPEPIDLDDLKAFSDALGAEGKSSVITRLRQEERY